MILKYSIENFKCFQEKETINFKAKKISESFDTESYLLLDNDILPIISIYGPNGGGKTSFIESISFLKNIALGSDKVNGMILHFLKNEKNVLKDIKWEIEFTSIDKSVYRYVLHYNNAITFESLFKKNDLIFKKNKDNVEFCKEILESNIKIENKAKESSMLQFINSILNNEDIAIVIREFKKINYLDSSEDITIKHTNGVPELDFGDINFIKNKKEIFIKIFIDLDINIHDLEFYEDPFNPNNIKIWSVKKSSFGSVFRIPFFEESKGTMKLLHLMTYFIKGLINKESFIIDELDSALHTKLLKYIIKLFNSKEMNKESQLIYTSHDMPTLNKENFRRDQIYFCAINESYFSNIISLKDIGARNDDKYYKKYLEGKYGYDPYIDYSIKAFDGKK